MNISLSIISGIFLALLFPKFNLYFLAWVALVPLLISIYKARSFGEAVLLGFLCGIIFFGITFSWITTLADYVSFWAYLAWIALVIYEGVFIAAFSGIAYKLRNYRFQIAIPIIWIAIEWLRGIGPYGVTGGGLGYSQCYFMQLIQIASWTGVYGISFLIVLVNTSIAELFIKRNRRSILQLLFALVLVLAVYFYGAIQILNFSPSSHMLKVGIVQGNIDQKIKLDYQNIDLIADIHIMLTEKIMQSRPNIVVWEETAIPTYLLEDEKLLSRIKKIFRDKSYFLIGTPYRERGHIYNSIVAFSGKGEILSRYDKERLVPFGEYLPLRGLFYPLLKRSSYLFEEDYNSNPKPVILKLGNLKIGAAICFESTFPYLVSQRERGGADFILVITNDAWFRASAALEQHLTASLLRAVEGRSCIVQVGNTGISAVIDPYGRVIGKTRIGERTVKIWNVGIKKEKTFYSQYGDFFVFLCIMLIPVFILLP